MLCWRVGHKVIPHRNEYECENGCDIKADFPAIIFDENAEHHPSDDIAKGSGGYERDKWTLEEMKTQLRASYKLTRVLHPTMLQQIVPFPLAAPNKLPNYGVPERLFPSKIELERFPESLYAARYEHSHHHPSIDMQLFFTAHP